MPVSIIYLESLPMEVLHCRNTYILYCSCDLDLMTFIYKLDPYSLEIYRMCKYELPTLRLLKVIIRQTDRQTNSLNYTPCGWSTNDAMKTNASLSYHWSQLTDGSSKIYKTSFKSAEADALPNIKLLPSKHCPYGKTELFCNSRHY